MRRGEANNIFYLIRRLSNVFLTYGEDCLGLTDGSATFKISTGRISKMQRGAEVRLFNLEL